MRCAVSVESTGYQSLWQQCALCAARKSIDAFVRSKALLPRWVTAAVFHVCHRLREIGSEYLGISVY